MTKLIKNWDELSKVEESETHYLEIEPEEGSGWIVTKNPVSDKFSDRMKYLSTHTFYGSTHEDSTRLLQLCGFDVEIANWDSHNED